MLSERDKKDRIGRAINVLDEMMTNCEAKDNYSSAARCQGARDELLTIWREMKIPSPVPWPGEDQILINEWPEDWEHTDPLPEEEIKKALQSPPSAADEVTDLESYRRMPPIETKEIKVKFEQRGRGKPKLYPTSAEEEE
jgi:hypothetical protein